MAALALLPSMSMNAHSYFTRCVRIRPGRQIGFNATARRRCSRASERDSERKTAEDMEQYLVDLSLEYESVWDTKPSWCQPWSIVLSGALAIASSWLVFHSILLTSLVTLVIGAWWFVFLYAYPLEYTNMIAERRQKIEEGDEDAFGMPHDF